MMVVCERVCVDDVDVCDGGMCENVCVLMSV